MKHIGDEYGSSHYRRLHRMDMILCIYSFIRLLIIGLMYLDVDRFPLYKYDYASLYCWENRKIVNKFFIIIQILITMIGFVGIKTFFYTPSNRLSIQILYDCIVYNTDQYYKSFDKPENIATKMSIRFDNHYCQHIHHHRHHQCSSMVMKKLFISIIIKHLIYIKVWLKSWLEMDHIDREMFEKINKMKLFPYATAKCRYNVVLFVMIIDFCTFIGHFIASKSFFFCFTRNKPLMNFISLSNKIKYH